MRKRLLALLFAAVPLTAQTVFPIGSGEIGPLAAEVFEAARTVNGAVAVWSARQNSGVHVARLDATGKALGNSFDLACTNPFVASDGRDALVLCSAESIVATRIERESDALALRNVAPSGTPVGLAWNGRDYVAAYRRDADTYAMVRLDRSGRPISGTVLLQGANVYAQFTFACGDGRCLAAVPQRSTLNRIALIDDGDYPAVGESALVPTNPFFPSYNVLVGFNDLGFYSITADHYGYMTVRIHGRLRNEYPDRVQMPLRTINVPGRWDSTAAYFSAASAGTDIYIAYRERNGARLYRVSPSGVRQLDVASASTRTVARLVPVATGALVFWRDAQQIVYASATSGNVLPAEKEAVSLGLAKELMPLLARGTNTLLATWVEQHESDSLFVSMLDLDGRPLTAPVRIAREPQSIVDAVAAFDGVNFLLVWTAYTDRISRVRGQFVGQDGKPIGATIEFDVRPEVLSLNWSRGAYLLADHNRFLRISTTGLLLDERPQYVGYDPAILVRDEENGQLRGLSMEVEPSIVSAGPLESVEYRWLNVDDRSTPIDAWTEGDTTRETFDYSPVPAVALGGGTRFAITGGGDWWGPPALRVFDLGQDLPYELPERQDRRVRLHAHWTGSEFVVVAGNTIARHAPDGTLLDTMSLGDDVLTAAAEADGPNAMVVLRQRGGSCATCPPASRRSLEAVRITLPAH